MQSKIITEILDRWLQTYKKIDLSLDRLNSFLDKIGNPHQSLPKTIHVAGTNGKGSTIAFLRSILETAGKNCHVYTSPHLLRFNERIVLNGKEIADNYLEEILVQIDEASRDHNLTYFEKTTAAAFFAFSQNPAEYLLLETGLGGRLDATNIVDKKALTIITPISYDHTNLLGNTLDKIASEKAGIMRENTLCISSVQPDEVNKTLREHANKTSCQLMFAPKLNPLPKLPLKGDFQEENASLAAHAAMNLGITKEVCLKGMQFAKWPARIQPLNEGHFAEILPANVELYLDGCHNQAAAEVVCNTIKPDFVIIGMMGKKDLEEFLTIFAGKIKGLCGIPIPGEDSCYPPEKIAETAHNLGIPSFFSEKLENALTDIVIRYPGNTKILICGSLYLAAKILEQNNKETEDA